MKRVTVFYLKKKKKVTTKVFKYGSIRMARAGEPYVTPDGSIPHFALTMQIRNTPSETSCGEISFWSMTLLLCAKK